MGVAEVDASHGKLGVACGAVGRDFFGGDGDGACGGVFWVVKAGGVW